MSAAGQQKTRIAGAKHAYVDAITRDPSAKRFRPAWADDAVGSKSKPARPPRRTT